MNSRLNALNNLSNTIPPVKVQTAEKITDIFNSNVFTLENARQFLNDDAYKSLLASSRGGKKIDRNMGNQIASGLRSAHTFMSAICIAATVIFWLGQ